MSVGWPIEGFDKFTVSGVGNQGIEVILWNQLEKLQKISLTAVHF